MDLNEFRQRMESDATKENEHLRSEVNLLRESLHDSKDHCEELKKSLTNDCQALANRCWVMTQGSMCCFCELNEFRCPHAMNDWQKIKFAKELIGGMENDIKTCASSNPGILDWPESILNKEK